MMTYFPPYERVSLLKDCNTFYSSNTMAESKLTPSQLYSRCIIWEKIRAEYFERIGDHQRVMQYHENALMYERKYQELPEVAHLYNAPQGIRR